MKDINDVPVLNKTALITGASSGIGYHLAREFAQHGYELVLVAPVESELEKVADELRMQHDVSVIVIAKDLRDENAARLIFEELTAQDIKIDVLCNNAGYGLKGRFEEITIEDDIGMVELNIGAVLRLTKEFLPGMLSRGHGRILNTASVAGFEPGPLLATYHATKAFVLSLSESLATELEDAGVTVTALCPGPVDTDFFPKAGMVDTNAFQKGNVMAPQEVAAAAYKAVINGERVIVPGGMNKAMVFSRRLTSESAQAKTNQKLYQDAAPKDRKREPGEIAAEAEVETKR